MCSEPNEGLHVNNYHTSKIYKYMLIAKEPVSDLVYVSGNINFSFVCYFMGNSHSFNCIIPEAHVAILCILSKRCFTEMKLFCFILV